MGKVEGETQWKKKSWDKLGRKGTPVQTKGRIIKNWGKGTWGKKKKERKITGKETFPNGTSEENLADKTRRGG